MTPSVDWWVSLIEAFVVINLVMATFAYLTLAERKVMGRMQLRYGPNRAGPRGTLQPIADLLKLLNKESFQPSEAIDWAFVLGPFLAAFTALTTFSVIPFGPGWTVGGVYIPGQVADLDIALILIFAIGSIGVYGFILGGWSSDSKYALLGSMRTCAQLVSYEVSLALSVLGIVLMAGTLSLTGIVRPRPTPSGTRSRSSSDCIVFLLAGTAETARAPFDLPEAEQELVAGYHRSRSCHRPRRRPQKRSAFCSSLAVRNCPSAVTTSAERRLSQARPCLRRSHPRPPSLNLPPRWCRQSRQSPQDRRSGRRG